MTLAAPEGLLYSDDDLWIGAAGDIRRVGVTDFAQDQLGDIVYLELPEPGGAVTAGRAFGVIESAKAVIDLISPVTGTVQSRNDAAIAEPTLVNTHPYTDAWLLTVRPTGALSAALMSAATYQSLRGD